jgi:hypothetical protein
VVSFAWLLAMPFLYYVESAVLVSDSPGQISSWEDHFFAARKKFFGIRLQFTSPWLCRCSRSFSCRSFLFLPTSGSPPNKALQLTCPELRSTPRRSVGAAHNRSRRLAPGTGPLGLTCQNA